MWLCALLALLTLDEALPLREVRPFNVDPSAISNIELLIPLSVPAERRERPERPDRDLSSETDEEYVAPSRRPHDREPFSSIPAYAFTLDDTAHTHRARGASTASPMLVKSRSLYLAQLWPRAGEQSEEGDSGANAAWKAGQEACHALARQQSGGARELLLYVCSELLDALAPRCAGERAVRPRAAPADKRSFPMPWFGPIGGRREWMPVKDRALPTQHVFV